MSTQPFDIIRCSWPCPITQEGRRWTSDPEWDAPSMASLPEVQLRNIEGHTYWTIDWRDVFSRHLHFHSPRSSGEMRGFHVVFEIRVRDSGTLIFWDDDGSIIRLDGKILHEDRDCHSLTHHEIAVRAGDRLEIGHWQCYGEWIWAGRIEPLDSSAATLDLFSEYLPLVQRELRRPDGPALKMYFGPAAPARSVLSLYSLILNGYRPASVHVFGESQWTNQARELFGALLPFAEIVPTANVLENLDAVSLGLANMAMNHWLVMKLCVSILCPPDEYCYLDDDIFILGSVKDATMAFEKHNLVYAPDADYSEDYAAIWNMPEKRPFSTGNINAGLYWLRNTHAPKNLAARILGRPPSQEHVWQWEQGCMAVEYAHEAAVALPSQRYFYPYFDGLPGGITGYDYAANPCRFASIHFGGLAEKPSDVHARMLAPQILKRGRSGR